MIEKMVKAAFYDEGGAVAILLKESSMNNCMRAALRAIKPEDVSDGMLGAFHLSNSIVATDETSDDRLRRALAAAIAAGAEQ